MKVKITFKYEVVYGQEIFECSSLEEAERKVKSMRSSEIDGCYLVRKEYENNKLVEEWYVG
jgi:hypothetical protein